MKKKIHDKNTKKKDEYTHIYAPLANSVITKFLNF